MGVALFMELHCCVRIGAVVAEKSLEGARNENCEIQ
jgi:hypothetical protein